VALHLTQRAVTSETAAGNQADEPARFSAYFGPQFKFKHGLIRIRLEAKRQTADKRTKFRFININIATIINNINISDPPTRPPKIIQI
jgi:hypothetical protein